MSFDSLYGDFCEPKGGKKYKISDLTNFLKQFKTNYGLGLIGQLSWSLGFKFRHINHLTIDDSILSYIAVKLIECSNDHRKKTMQPQDLLKACDIWFGINFLEGAQNNRDNVRRYTNWQFSFRRNPRYLLSRTLLLYSSAWNSNTSTQNININDAIFKCFSLSLEEILIFTNYFCDMARNGYVSKFNAGDDSVPVSLLPFYDQDRQSNYLSLFSYNYNDFREALIQLNSNPQILNLPDNIKDIVRFNPLKVSPLISPKLSVKLPIWETYLLPVPRLLYEASTSSLYYKIDDYFKKKRKENFQSLFGDVFNKYIGILLKETLEASRIVEEFVYTQNKAETRKTIDWIITHDNKAIYIEAKSSGIFKTAKITGDEEQIREDLSTTLAGGAEQLADFIADIESNKFLKLARYKAITEYECVIVCLDAPFFLNSDIRDRIYEILDEKNVVLPNNFHFHIMSIDDFEVIIDAFSQDLYSFFKNKRLNKEREEFRNYLFQEFPDIMCVNKYLDKVDREFFGRFGFNFKD